MYKLLLTFCLIILFAGAAGAQQIDTLSKKSKTDKVLQEKRDSVKANPIVPKVKERVYHPDSNHSPHKAIMRSLIIPGWGQLYNHQLWLVPPIYVGLGLLVRSYLTNLSDYHGYLAVAKYRETATAPSVNDKYYTLYKNYAPYSDPTINDAVAGAKRNTEICVFGFAAVWGIQIIQAYIEAKFQHTYTIDNDLSMKASPMLITAPMYAGNLNSSYITGLKLTFTLR